MKSLLFICFIIVGMILVGVLTMRLPVQSKDEGRVPLKVGSHTLQVEVVRSPTAIEKGLGERDTLGSDGMLFVLGQKRVATFWMKGMRFALDFVWIDGNKIVEITPNVLPQPGVTDAQLTLYSSKVPVTHVLELNAGEVKKRGIRVGDAVELLK